MKYMSAKDFNYYQAYLHEIENSPKRSEAVEKLHSGMKKLRSITNESEVLHVLGDIIDELKQLEVKLTPNRKLIKTGMILQSRGKKDLS